MWTKTVIPSLFVLASLVVSAPLHGFELGERELGGQVGLQFNLLARPTDPVGSPTLLQGSGFAGWGYAFGVTGTQAWMLDDLTLLTRTDAILAFQRASGYAESADQAQRRDVTLESTTLLSLIHI